jgi:methylenetetrahydrofolate reductase (NADPH)
MKLSALLSEAAASGEVSLSLEFFVPDSEEGLPPLRERLTRLARTEPLFVDLVGAGSVTAAHAALSLASFVKQRLNLAPVLHVCAADLPRPAAAELLGSARAAGVHNLLVELGGGAAAGDSLPSAAAFVQFVHKMQPGFFCVGVVGFPRGCAGEAGGFERNLEALAAAARAGAEFVVAAHTYEAEPFVELVAEAAKLGLRLPMVPSLALPPSWAAYEALAAGTGARAAAEDAWRPVAGGCDGDAAFRGAATSAAAALGKELLALGAAHALHFVTLNLEGGLRCALEALGLFSSGGGAGGRRKLPWRPVALEGARAGEDVRPIFWGNRAASYVDRTAAWACFPSGRWMPPGGAPPGGEGGGGVPGGGAPGGGAPGGGAPGASAPPAAAGRVFGALHPEQLVASAGTAEERRAMWGPNPSCERDVWAVFEGYVRGTVPRLPWCEVAIAPETSLISNALAALNCGGFLTINSQPRVNGASSSDPTFGWGGAGGRVYQKAYIECFCPPKHLAALMEAAARAAPGGGGRVTYHAVNAAGAWHTNGRARGSVNAVTWGVFPDREILQPTVMDPASFVGPWKDEAFALWGQWSSAYEEGGEAHATLCDVTENYFLVAAVDNEYESGDGLFDLFRAALAVLAEGGGGGGGGSGGDGGGAGAEDPAAVAHVLQQQRAALNACKTPRK